jgi:hypothetical protein
MSLLQLKKREAEPVVAPAWHPNFRDFERLPDTKVVRTAFFINVAAGVLAVVLAGFVGWREYETRAFTTQAAAAEARIAENKARNAEALRLTKAINDEERKFAEAAAFVKGALSPTEFITILGQTLPREIQLEYLDYRPHDPNSAQCTIRGLAAGSKDQASGVASAYVETLRTQPRFTQVFSAVELRALNPDARTGTLIFEIVLKFKPATTGGGK